MGTINLQIPQSGSLNATEDPKIASDLTAIQTLLNGQLDTSNLSPTAGIVLAQLAVAVQQALFTPGDLKPTAAPAASAGWLICDGSPVSRTTYAALFAVCGVLWGAGDGTNTFNVPDLRGKTTVGAGTGPGLSVRTLGPSGVGEENHALLAGESGMPGHGHGLNWSDPTHAHGPAAETSYIYASGAAQALHSTSAGGTNQIQASSFSAVGNTAAAATNISASVAAAPAVNAGAAHNNMPPFAVLNWLIKT